MAKIGEFSLVTQLCPTLCNPMDFSMPGLPVHHQCSEFAQTHVHGRERNGNPLQLSCLENPMDRGAWWAAVHRIAQSQTWLKRMATLSSILAWRIPGTEEHGGLPSVGLHRVGHNWSNLAAGVTCPLSRWCHPTISSSVVPFSSCLQAFPESGSFQMSRLFASGGQSIGVSVSTSSVLPKNIQDWSPLGWPGWISLQSKGLSRVFSNTTVQKHQFPQHSAFLIVQLSHPYMTTGKTIALTRQTFVWQSNVSAF